MRTLRVVALGGALGAAVGFVGALLRSRAHVSPTPYVVTPANVPPAPQPGRGHDVTVMGGAA